MSWALIEQTTKHRVWKCRCGALACAGTDRSPPAECGKCHAGAEPPPPVRKRR